jgi:hypothetical protein
VRHIDTQRLEVAEVDRAPEADADGDVAHGASFAPSMRVAQRCSCDDVAQTW